MKSDDSDEEAENEAVQSSSAPGKSPKLPKHDLTMTDEVSYHVTGTPDHPYQIRILLSPGNCNLDYMKCLSSMLISKRC